MTSRRARFLIGFAIAAVPLAVAVAPWYVTIAGEPSAVSQACLIASLLWIAASPAIAGYRFAGTGAAGAVIGALIGMAIGATIAGLVHPGLTNGGNDGPGLFIAFAWFYLATPSGFIGLAVAGIVRRYRGSRRGRHAAA